MDEFERLVSDVEAIVVDGPFTEMQKEITETQAILDSGSLDDEDTEELLNLLNQRWKAGHYASQDMNVSGELYVGGEYEPMMYGQLEEGSRTTLANYPMRTSTFAIVTDMRETEAGLAMHRQLLLTGRILLESDDEEDEGSIDGMTEYTCAVEVNPNMYLDIPTQTLDRANAWLDTYAPQLKMEIDACLMGADDEAEMTMALRDVSYDLSSLSEAERQETILNLQTYLFHNVKYDQIVPYLSELHGDIITYNEEANEHQQMSVREPQKALLVPVDLLCDVDEETGELLLGLTGRLVRDKIRQTNVQVPLSSLTYMIAGRTIFEEYL